MEHPWKKENSTMNTETRDESSLGDDVADTVSVDPPSPEDQLEQYSTDLTPELDPDDFDFDAFLAGARPFRRSVTLFMRPDLVAELDQLGAAIIRSTDEDEKASLLERFNTVKAAFYASAKTFVVEGRSPEWVDERRGAMVKDYGLSLKKNGELSEGPRREEALEAITHRLLIEQIAIPSAGLTVEKMAQLADKLPGEYRKLLTVQGFVNSSLAENSKVLSVDFSRGPSVDTQG